MVASTQGRQRNYDLNPLSVAKTLVEDLLHIHYRQPYAQGALATADQHQLYTSTVFPFFHSFAYNHFPISLLERTSENTAVIDTRLRSWCCPTEPLWAYAHFSSLMSGQWPPCANMTYIHSTGSRQRIATLQYTTRRKQAAENLMKFGDMFLHICEQTCMHMEHLSSFIYWLRGFLQLPIITWHPYTDIYVRLKTDWRSTLISTQGAILDEGTRVTCDKMWPSQ